MNCTKNEKMAGKNLKHGMMRKVVESAQLARIGEGGWPPCIGIFYQPEHPLKKSGGTDKK